MLSIDRRPARSPVIGGFAETLKDALDGNAEILEHSARNPRVFAAGVDHDVVQLQNPAAYGVALDAHRGAEDPHIGHDVVPVT